MNIDLNEAPLQEQEGPVLHLGKKLLPIDEYSSHTGLSRGLLEQYGRIGIIQIRKYKGRTFVVDVPSQLRFGNAETEAIEELLSLRNKTLQTKKLTELVAKLISNPKTDPAPPEQIPDLKLFGTLTNRSMPANKAAMVKQPGFERLFAKIQTTQIGQVLMIFVISFLIVSVYVSFWLLLTGKVQNRRFAGDMRSVQEVISESGQPERRIDKVQNQLSNSISQANIIHTDIAVAMSELETIQRSNKEAVRKLDEQFAKLKLLK